MQHVRGTSLLAKFEVMPEKFNVYKICSFKKRDYSRLLLLLLSLLLLLLIIIIIIMTVTILALN